LGESLGSLAKFNNSDARCSRKCPRAVDLENMVMQSARHGYTKKGGCHAEKGEGLS
jgi:hypothetical protein